MILKFDRLHTICQNKSHVKIASYVMCHLLYLVWKSMETNNSFIKKCYFQM